MDPYCSLFEFPGISKVPIVCSLLELPGIPRSLLFYSRIPTALSCIVPHFYKKRKSRFFLLFYNSLSAFMDPFWVGYLVILMAFKKGMLGT